MMKIAMLRNEKKTIAGSDGPPQFFSVSEILVYTKRIVKKRDGNTRLANHRSQRSRRTFCQDDHATGQST